MTTQKADDILKRIAPWQKEMAGWRRHIHAHPETAFEEVKTSAFVAEKLRSFGLEVHEGLAQTGVVATLRNGPSNRAIGLRADMDALDLSELNEFDHKSTVDGKMHACGHDGHTTMLLGAARYMAEHRNFDGTVHFIFQPAEENEGGGRVMVEEGLFEKFPVDAVFGLHNMPGVPVGMFAVRPGPMMAGFDIFEIEITGNGGHAAIPHMATDPIPIAAQVVTGLQSIVSRNVDPQKSAVISVTKIHAGDAYNVIPNSVHIAGCARYFHPAVQSLIERRMTELSKQIASAYGATASVTYEPRYPATINSEEEAEFCAGVLKDLVGEDRVNTDPTPMMGSEDFSFMLQAKPGCYIWAGNGRGEGSCMVHNPNYDFNDEGIPWGIAYWVQLVEKYLPADRTRVAEAAE